MTEARFTCPSCKSPMPQQAVICMICGFDLRTGATVDLLRKKSHPPVFAHQRRVEKTCRFCGNNVLVTAIKCKHCGSDLTEAKPSQAIPAGFSHGEAWGIIRMLSRPAVLWAVVAVLIVALGGYVFVNVRQKGRERAEIHSAILAAEKDPDPRSAVAKLSGACRKYPSHPLVVTGLRSTMEALERDESAIESVLAGGSAEQCRAVAPEIRRLADRGCARAQHCMGLMCSEGRGAPRNANEAVAWFSKAADRGLADAQCEMGTRYCKGDGVERIPSRGVGLLQKAADGGNPKAQYEVALCLEDGKMGLQKDSQKALDLMSRSAEANHAPALNALGNRYKGGIGVARDSSKAFDCYRRAAELGDIQAEHNLGVCYMQGIGVREDRPTALAWYLKAAEKGLAESQFMVGLIYSDSSVVAADRAKEAKWLGLAAEQGMPEAQYALGGCYYRGEGVDRDLRKASALWSKAADQGHAPAIYSLGLLHLRGEGMEKNQSKAAELFLRAAEGGNPTAQYLIGSCYEDGTGVKSDISKAVEWYSKSAEAGDPSGQSRLGLCYEFGKGVPANVGKAYELYRAAARQGYQPAVDYLKTEPRNTPEAPVAAQRRVPEAVPPTVDRNARLALYGKVDGAYDTLAQAGNRARQLNAQYNRAIDALTEAVTMQGNTSFVGGQAGTWVYAYDSVLDKFVVYKK